jgi:hypothetical protein
MDKNTRIYTQALTGATPLNASRVKPKGADSTRWFRCGYWLLGFVLIGCCTASLASPIFGHWSLAPDQATLSEAEEDSGKKQKTKKKSRKEKKKEKKRAKLRQGASPAVLKTTSLQIRRKDEATVELIPRQGAKLVLQPDGKAPSLSLSNWGAYRQPTVRFSTWEGDTLVVESTPQQGMHFVHSYSVNPAGLLVQDIELFDGLDSQSQRRLFEPQQGVAQ